MKLHLKVALASDSDEEFFGAGLLCLLEGIDRNGSIQQAAKEMNLSYVKALKILNRVERELGEKLLIRQKGGANRGKSELTPFAREFSAEFSKLRQKMMKAGNREFSAFLGRFGPKKA